MTNNLVEDIENVLENCRLGEDILLFLILL